MKAFANTPQYKTTARSVKVLRVKTRWPFHYTPDLHICDSLGSSTTPMNPQSAFLPINHIGQGQKNIDLAVLPFLFSLKSKEQSWNQSCFEWEVPMHHLILNAFLRSKGTSQLAGCI